MAFGKEVATRFPIDKLFFTFTVGIFIALAFPYDVASLDVPHVLREIDLLDSGFRESLVNYVAKNFTAFVGVRHLGSYEGIFSVILLGFPIGIVILLFYGAYQKANHLLMRVIILPLCRECQKTKHLLMRVYHFVTQKPSALKKDKNETPASIEGSEFVYWIREKKHERHLHFILSVREVATGLLYGSETLCVFSVLACLAHVFTGAHELSGRTISLPLLSFILSGIAYEIHKRDFMGSYNALLVQYRKEASPLGIRFE